MERYYEAIDLLKGMISRPSFSRDETAVADFLQAEWQKAGQKVFRKGNNLWIIVKECNDRWGKQEKNNTHCFND